MHIYVGFEFELAVRNNQSTIKNWYRFPTGLDVVLALAQSLHELSYSVPVAVIKSATCKFTCCNFTCCNILKHVWKINRKIA